MNLRQTLALFLLLTPVLRAQDHAPQQSPPKAAAQNPTPMTESARTHTRLTKVDVPGKRVDLSIGTLLIPTTARIRPTIPLYIHFHGTPWVPEQSIHAVNPHAAILTFNLGAGSGVYSRAFHDPA